MRHLDGSPLGKSNFYKEVWTNYSGLVPTTPAVIAQQIFLVLRVSVPTFTHLVLEAGCCIAI